MQLANLAVRLHINERNVFEKYISFLNGTIKKQHLKYAHSFTGTLQNVLHHKIIHNMDTLNKTVSSKPDLSYSCMFRKSQHVKITPIHRSTINLQPHKLQI